MKDLFLQTALYAVIAFVPVAVADDNVCAALDECIFTDLITFRSECYLSHVRCERSLDVFAVTARDLAFRAIGICHCDTRHFSTLKGCNQCYDLSGRALTSRFDQQLFHGLLSQASADLKVIKSQKCGNKLDSDYILMVGNLNSNTPAIDGVPQPTHEVWEREAAFAVSSVIVDGLGVAHSLKTYFFHTFNYWTVEITAEGSELVGRAPGAPGIIAGYLVFFGPNGLRSYGPAYPSLPGDILISPEWSNGAPLHYVPVLFELTTFPSAHSVVVTTTSQE